MMKVTRECDPGIVVDVWKDTPEEAREGWKRFREGVREWRKAAAGEVSGLNVEEKSGGGRGVK